MAKMHSRKRGQSGSTRPSKKEKKSWTRQAQEVEQLVAKVARQGNEPSMVGMILRDSYGIPDVKIITGKSITKILEENKIEMKLPEDMRNLVKKCIRLMKHTEANKKDLTVKRGLRLTESKINRLAKYYKRTGKLPENWKYNASKAKLLLE